MLLKTTIPVECKRAHQLFFTTFDVNLYTDVVSTHSRNVLVEFVRQTRTFLLLYSFLYDESTPYNRRKKSRIKRDFKGVEEEGNYYFFIAYLRNISVQTFENVLGRLR